MDIKQKQRQQRLREQLSEIEQHQQVLSRELKSFEMKRDSFARDLDVLKSRHVDCSRSELLGRSSDRERVEREINATSAMIVGCQSVIDEKQHKHDEIASQLGPIEAELREMDLVDKREALLREIAESFEAGKQELLRLGQLEKSFLRRCTDLREKYACDPEARAAGTNASEALVLARRGVPSGRDENGKPIWLFSNPEDRVLARRAN
jgi:septal ring factor EnvC (AmiA/AmiB activator)